MPVSVHIVRLGNFQVDASGFRIDKNSPSTKISDVLSSSMATLIMPASDVPNSANYPTIEAFLKLEAAAGYKLQHLDQTFCITYQQ